MREQNIALIQNVYDAFRRGDIPTVMAAIADQTDWQLEGPASVPFATHSTTPQEVLERFFMPLGTTLKDTVLTIDEVFADGDHVISLGRFSGTVVATGKKLDTPLGHFFTVKNGKITRFVDFNDTAGMAAAYAA